MFIILFLLMLGMGIGCIVRRYNRTINTARTTSVTIAALIFIFGAGIGSKQTILDNLDNIGMPALTISLLGILGSLVAAYFYDRIFNKKGGPK